MQIEIKNYKGNLYKGYWNEKTYGSKIVDNPSLLRIYVDDVQIHVTQEELDKAVGDSKILIQRKRIDDIYKRLDQNGKLYMLKLLFEDCDIIRKIQHGYAVNNDTEIVDNLEELRNYLKEI